ncbi:hypothetical protein GGQ60_002766 [Pedobacter zeae]|uniref:Uncharacterized protein n=1 Tax=Pedobacter zeae TaxID=1737356 RepID=A0A7W6P649_9SPHI|nr:hypothetical protein [Pedobacter zeae]
MESYSLIKVILLIGLCEESGIINGNSNCHSKVIIHSLKTISF